MCEGFLLCYSKGMSKQPKGKVGPPRPKTIHQRARELARLVPVVQPAEAPLETNRGKGHLWPAVQVEQHMAAIESLLLSTYSQTAIARTMTQRFGLKKTRVEDLIKRVKARWLAEDVEARPTNKSSQVRRLLGYIANARGERNDDGRGWKVQPNYQALRAFESLLADVQGTKAPIEINVDVRVGQALREVISNMTPEQLTLRLERARAQRAAAERLELLEQNPVIEVKVQ